MSAFTRCFLFLRNPAGGVENVSDMKAAGFEGVFCNVGDFAPEQWDVVRQRCQALGMFCGPWARTAKGDPPQWDQAKLERIIQTADRWGAPLIVNSEKELDGSGATITTEIAKAIGTRDAAISMETTPFASVDWSPVAHLPVLPQVFPAESGKFDTTEAWRKAWWDAGMRCVYMTFGTYAAKHGRPEPTWYELQAPYSLYTADDIEDGPAGYPNWSPTSTGYVACKEASMKIGDQDGISASANRLRALDPGGTIVPQGKTIDDLTQPLSQWKAWDKLERTLRILKDDHDAAV